MKIMKKISALVIAMVMVLAMALPAMASEYPNVVNPHVITIDNSDQNVTHTYKAYKLFKGNLNAAEDTLSDIEWGDGIASANLISALKASTKFGDTNPFAEVATAKDVAAVLSTFDSTSGLNQSAGAIDEFAALVKANLGTATGVDFTPGANGQYTANVNGDGYYFIMDTTADAALDGANGTDTVSKYLLRVIRDTTVVAKDTGTTDNKHIVEDGKDVNDNDAAIGDTITYKSELKPVPNPTKYNRFKMEMLDTMEKGLTFTGISSITLGDKTLEFGKDYYYYVNDTKYDTAQYVAPTDPAGTGAPDANATETSLHIVFINAKALIMGNATEGNEPQYAGTTLTVNYTAVLNKNAEIAPQSNDNTVHFEFSNDANYNYEGDEISSTDPKGVTPTKTVETYTTSIKIYKTDGTKALAGATFTIKATVFNKSLVTAEKFTPADDGTYYLLKDGSYTTTVPGSTVNGQVVNDTQYASTTQKYKLETVTQIVTDPVGEEKVYTLISDANGIIKLEGLKAGIYTITEAIAPDGYNLLEGDTIINIDWSTVHDKTLAEGATENWASPTDEQKTEANGGFTLVTTGNNKSSDGVTMTVTGGTEFGVTIANFQGSRLPSTGGIGTTIFYVIGGILVVLAGIVLVTRRKSAE